MGIVVELGMGGWGLHVCLQFSECGEGWPSECGSIGGANGAFEGSIREEPGAELVYSWLPRGLDRCARGE